MSRLLLTLLLTVASLLLTSCAGGGSSGTGTGEIFTLVGQVVDTSGQPVQDATITLLETGDMVLSNKEGNFTIQLDMEVGQVLTLEVVRGDGMAIQIIQVPQEDSFLILSIKINPVLEEQTTETVTMRAKIVGTCDIFFENNEIIRQANAIAQGTECLAKVTFQTNDGFGLAHAPIAIQYRACESGAPWQTVALGATMTGVNLGVAQIPFSYFDDTEHCQYRIVVPFQSETISPLKQFISTFTEQRMNERKR